MIEKIKAVFVLVGYPVIEIYKHEDPGTIVDPIDPLFDLFETCNYAVVTRNNVLLDDSALDIINALEEREEITILKLCPGYNKSLLVADGYHKYGEQTC